MNFELSGRLRPRGLPASLLQSHRECGAAVQAARTVTVADTTAPAITLTGANPLVIELGGDSLLATQVVARLRAVLSIDLSLRDVMEHATIRRLAAAMAARAR